MIVEPTARRAATDVSPGTQSFFSIDGEPAAQSPAASTCCVLFVLYVICTVAICRFVQQAPVDAEMNLGQG